MENSELIDDWLVRSSSNDVVLVIGAGLSKNAKLAEANITADKHIPLWNDLIVSVQSMIGMSSFDPLLSFDIFKKSFGQSYYEQCILKAMPDDELVPDKIHNLLSRFPRIKAIITTNNIDTLLDKTFNDAQLVIHDTDIARLHDDKLCIYYLHGHRSQPDSWIFSRSDYEDITERYPIKVSICKSLLSRYPSLFIGFGHSDPDLHSMLRFVNKTIGIYKPAMLSVSASLPNLKLEKYWESIGLSVVSIATKEKKISQSLYDTLKYIIERRTDSLQKSHMISPGYRLGDSIMDSIRTKNLTCSIVDGSVNLCKYHMSRSLCEIYHIQDMKDLILISPYSSQVKKGSETEFLIKRILSGYNPAGSWGLMPTHRNWLVNGIQAYCHTGDTVKVLITGIAGLPHFVDILSIIYDSGVKCNFDITVIDICEGPIEMIRRFIEDKSFIYHTSDHQMYEKVWSWIDRSEVQVSLIHDDLFHICANLNHEYDIVLSHHLISFWGKSDLNMEGCYYDVVHSALKANGILIAAQNIIPSDSFVLHIQEIMRQHSLVPINSLCTFDVYDVSKNQKMDDGVYTVDNETLLTIHKCTH